jgi:hypothetical protein
MKAGGEPYARARALFTPASAIARYDIRGTPIPRSRQPLKESCGYLQARRSS